MNSTSILIRVTAPAQFTKNNPIVFAEGVVGAKGRIEKIVPGVSNETNEQQNIAVAVITNCAAECARFDHDEEVMIVYGGEQFERMPSLFCPGEKVVLSTPPGAEVSEEGDRNFGHPLLTGLVYPDGVESQCPGEHFIARSESKRAAGVSVR